EEHRPDEDLEERAAVLLRRQDLAEVAPADRRLPPGLELLRAVHERALAVVAEDGAVGDAPEGVRLRVVAERRLELGGRRDRLRLDLAAAADRHVQAAELLVHREELLALDDREALGRRDPERARRDVGLRERR